MKLFTKMTLAVFCLSLSWNVSAQTITYITRTANMPKHEEMPVSLKNLLRSNLHLGKYQSQDRDLLFAYKVHLDLDGVISVKAEQGISIAYPDGDIQSSSIPVEARMTLQEFAQMAGEQLKIVISQPKTFPALPVHPNAKFSRYRTDESPYLESVKVNLATGEVIISGFGGGMLPYEGINGNEQAPSSGEFRVRFESLGEFYSTFKETTLPQEMGLFTAFSNSSNSGAGSKCGAYFAR